MTYETENPALTAEVLDDIGAERARQFAKWGPQHHENGTGPASVVDIAGMQFTPALLEQWFRQQCDRKFRAGTGTWLDILLEEVFEAAAEGSPMRLAAELTQVAAVAAAWREDIISRE
jgi:hypothetical protein